MKKTENMPRTPFSTALSGSAKETELRIRNIFQWKKKRPPVWLMALTAAVCLSCGSLVSCQAQPAGPELVMDIQYYDNGENYIEIPALALPGGAEPDAGVTAVNEALAELKDFYLPVLDGTAGTDGSALTGRENRCLLYPTETERYLCLTFFRDEYHTDLNTGHVTSLVYDKEAGQQVTLDEALALAGQTEAGLCQALADQFNPTLGQDVPDADLCIQNQALEGFRMGADGQPLFYLTARTDDRDDTVLDAVSGADNLYIWAGGTFTLYDQHTLEPDPLVPAEECLDLDPPLWRQWHFAGEEPVGGLSPAAASQSRALLEILYDAAAEQVYIDAGSMDQASPTLLHASSQDGYTLAAATFRDSYAAHLVIGAIEESTGVLTGPAYVLGGQGGAPHVLAYEPYGEAGAVRLLYTFNSMSQALIYGEAGAAGLSDGRLAWAWPVEGDILEAGSQAQADYYTYWADHLALMAPGGVDVFTQTNYSVIDGDGPQWVPDHNELFYAAAEEELPTGVYYQVRTWLEEFTRTQYNPWDSRNASAVWQIVSLAPADGVYPDRNFDGVAVYDLTARADNGEDLWFTAFLFFDHQLGQVVEVQDFHEGTQAEMELTDPGLVSQSILDHYKSRESGAGVYYPDGRPSQPQEGALLLSTPSYIGMLPLNNGAAAVYAVPLSRYGLHRENAQDPGTWDFFPAGFEYVVLSTGGSRGVPQVLGTAPTEPDRDIRAIVYETMYGLRHGEVSLLRDGWNTPIGPGMELAGSCLDNMNWESRQLEGHEPIHAPGDYWFQVSGTCSAGGFTALCYYSQAEDRSTIHTLDTTMTDLTTYGGIRIGDARSKVLTCHPYARTGDYWGQYPGEDILYYIPGLFKESDGFYDELGPAILFFFDDSGQTVERIVLTVTDS